MKAIIVCVDYWDYLQVTLPYNRHHFQDVMIVTSMTDDKTVEVAKSNNCQVYQTDSFYEGGANFNKWKALEEGFDALGRKGWMCILDADIVWPKTVKFVDIEIGNLYTPFRRMCDPQVNLIPEESTWTQYPLHRQQKEFAGFTQIFHADDPHLPSAPWHQINWKHAGGADTFFQKLWPESNKIRPQFEVLHLGHSGKNWCGRATPFADGELPEQSKARIDALTAFMQGRRRIGGFSHEKLT